MAVQSIGSPTPAPTPSTQQLGLTQQDFLKILLTQLTYQDPLKPMDNQQFVAQMAQFSALEQAKQTNDSINGLETIQNATQAIGLIGKSVQVQTSTGSVVATVQTVTFNNSTPELTVQESTGATLTGISLGQIVVVQ